MLFLIVVLALVLVPVVLVSKMYTIPGFFKLSRSISILNIKKESKKENFRNKKQAK